VEVSTGTAPAQTRPPIAGTEEGREERRRTEQPDRRAPGPGARPAPTQH